MFRRVPLRRLIGLALVFGFAGRDPRAVTEPPPDPIRLGLYEWMAVAPNVIVADIVADDGRFVVASVRAALKGELTPGSVALVDVKQANRDRDERTPATELTKGRAYLLLLKTSSKGKREPHPVFDLVRAAAGTRALPPEGSEAIVDASTRLAELQARNDDGLLWATLPEFLQDANPVLVDAALELYVKFRRETAALAPVIQPLLEHPRPDFRRRAALVLGRLLVRSGATAVPERAEIVAELTGRARRDDDASVRREATSALAALPDAGIDESLRTIARDDPDQDVRFEAEKSLFARAQASAPKRPD